MTIEPTILETNRLLLLPPDPSFAGELLALNLRCKEQFEPWEPLHAEGYYTLDFQRESLENDARARKQGAACRFMIQHRDENALIGTLGLSNIVRGPFCSAYVNYKLDTDHTGQGLMKEALDALICYAFGPLGLHRLEANILPANTPSLNVAKRAAFANDGLARKHLAIRGK